MDNPYFFETRQRMVIEQIERRGVRGARVLEAMRRVPRHAFVARELRDLAYADRPLPTGYGQTISQPYIVARMTDLLRLEGEETILEVGTGSGYQAAVLSHLSREVHTIEYYADLAERAQALLRELGICNVWVHVGDGTLGMPAFAPYQGILVTAAAPYPPPPLIDQLGVGGRLVLPVGDRTGQDLEVWRRMPKGLAHKRIEPVAFVPLRGVYGWRDEEWE